MLKPEKNRQLTQVGPGTPAGKLLRRYWFPVATAAQLRGKATKRVRLLGEDLVLFRNTTGGYGLIQEGCPHRRASLAYGIPEPEGLRCMYHGWLFGMDGACLEQPNEPEASNFASRVQATTYPVEQLGGLFFAYLGPEPAPLLPKFDLLVDDGYRAVGHTVLPCNWLQIMENTVDPTHVEWLHGAYFDHLLKERGDEPMNILGGRRHVEIEFDEFDFGIIKRRLLEGGSKEHDAWAVGHPLVFPAMLKTGGSGIAEFQFRVPVDDGHTWHVWYTLYQPPGVDVAPQDPEDIPTYEVPFRDESGEFITDFAPGQDMMAWVSQGQIADRSAEHLGTSDKGVIALRQMLNEQMSRVEEGEDPIGVLREPAKAGRIGLPIEGDKFDSGRHWETELRVKQGRYNPRIDEVAELFSQAESVDRRASAPRP